MLAVENCQKKNLSNSGSKAFFQSGFPYQFSEFFIFVAMWCTLFQKEADLSKCWGYENNCEVNRRMSVPKCSGDFPYGWCVLQFVLY